MAPISRNSKAIRLPALAVLGLTLMSCLSPEEDARKVETSILPGMSKPEAEAPTLPDHGSASPLPKTSAASGWVGFIPKDPDILCWKRLLRQDNEDNATSNRMSYMGRDWWGFNTKVGGLYSAQLDEVDGSKTDYTICQEFVDVLPVMKYDYAVLSHAEACPTNGLRFMRKFDDEDINNHNSSDKELLPTFAINSYSQLYFCFVPGNPNAANDFPQMDFINTGKNLERDYMIFAENHDYPSYGNVLMDDEDDRNNNSFTNYGNSTEMFNRFMKIIRGVNGGGADGRGRNSQLFFAAKGVPPKISTVSPKL